jgi:hypothetical protein
VDVSAHTWVSSGECKWKSHKCLESVISLEERYPGLQGLFVDRLKIRDVSISDFIKELKSLSGQTQHLFKIKTILRRLNCLVGKKHLDVEDLRTLKGLAVLPVRRDTTEMRSCLDKDWLIPDRGVLQRCFEGHIWLLDFPVMDCADLDPSLKKLGLHERLLSSRVGERTSIAGETKSDITITNWLRTKAPIIARYGEMCSLSRFNLKVTNITQTGAEETGWCNQ